MISFNSIICHYGCEESLIKSINLSLFLDSRQFPSSSPCRYLFEWWKLRPNVCCKSAYWSRHDVEGSICRPCKSLSSVCRARVQQKMRVLDWAIQNRARKIYRRSLGGATAAVRRIILQETAEPAARQHRVETAPHEQWCNLLHIVNELVVAYNESASGLRSLRSRTSRTASCSCCRQLGIQLVRVEKSGSWCVEMRECWWWLVVVIDESTTKHFCY